MLLYAISISHVLWLSEGKTKFKKKIQTDFDKDISDVDCTVENVYIKL